MSQLVCKYCGGLIRLTGASVGVCESCGTRVTLPKTDEARIADLYNRADHLRRIHDYDGAISAYEHIAAEMPTDPEARWNVVLCRYGIEYTYDTRTEQYLPAINRMSLSSILEDRDYLLAVGNADEASKELYRKAANRIAAIQEELARIVHREKPYDVFISFKSSDGRKRTRDYVLAQEIYDTLTAEGFRVFFSPVTLRQHPGELYEPYIFSALYTAKVMVLVGTRREYLEAEWVRNEWSRYLYMMRENSAKHLLPVYETMRPEDFPAPIARMQAVHMGDIGAMKTICDRIREFTGDKEKVILVRKADGSSVNLTNILRRISFLVEDGEFDEAEDRIDDFIGDYGSDFSRLHYEQLLLRYRAKNISELALLVDDSIKEDEDYRYVMEHGSEEEKQELRNLILTRQKAVRDRQEEEAIREIRQLYENEKYHEAFRRIGELTTGEVPFSRSAELEDIAALTKKRIEEHDTYMEYWYAVGNGKDYLKKKLKEADPALYAAFEPYRNVTAPQLTSLRFDFAMLFASFGFILVWWLLKNEMNDLVKLWLIGIGGAYTYRLYRRWADGFELLPLIGAAVLSYGLILAVPAIIWQILSSVRLDPEARERREAFFHLVKTQFRGSFGHYILGVEACCFLTILLGVGLVSLVRILGQRQARAAYESQVKRRRELLVQVNAIETEAINELERKYKAVVGDRWIPISKTY